MQDTPLISIALCTCNGERFLREQLDSLLAQDHVNLEIVAVDDASTDGTPAILEACAARDPRVRLFRNAANLGFRRNFQEAIGRCRGDFIAPCDQDDVWRPDKLRLLLEAIGDAAAAYCDSELVDGQGRPLGLRLSDKRVMGPIDDPLRLALQNCVSGHAMLFRRSLVARALPIPDGLFHDWWLALVAAGSGGIAHRPEPLVQYRQHRQAATDMAGLRRSARPRGQGLAGFEAAEQRLHACAALEPGGLGPELLRLWRGCRQQYLCPRLALLAFRHRHRLFSFYPNRRKRRARYALKLLWGLRLKRLFDPNAYALPSPGAGRGAPGSAGA